MIVKEKLDGTNATIYITETAQVFAGSKNKWITPDEDNHGFAKWVKAHEGELLSLGPGMFRGEWLGAGINGNRYGLKDKQFFLFDHRFFANPAVAATKPDCVSVVPILHVGAFDIAKVNEIVTTLRELGSVQFPTKPAEGVVVWLPAAMSGFKVTCHDDEMSKGEAEARAKAGN
jgi:hypothetical protein